MALSLSGSISATITKAGGNLEKLSVSFRNGEPLKLVLSDSFEK